MVYLASAPQQPQTDDPSHPHWIDRHESKKIIRDKQVALRVKPIAHHLRLTAGCKRQKRALTTVASVIVTPKRKQMQRRGLSWA
jgi:hypothetical protein